MVIVLQEKITTFFALPCNYDNVITGYIILIFVSRFG